MITAADLEKNKRLGSLIANAVGIKHPRDVQIKIGLNGVVTMTIEKVVHAEEMEAIKQAIEQDRLRQFAEQDLIDTLMTGDA